VQPEPLVPGFEVSLELPAVPGFGEQLDNPTLEQLRAKYDERVVERVERALREYDRNGNGILDLEEWSTVDWRSDPRESDLNKDGKLTRLELAERYARYYSSSSSGSSGSSSGSSGSSGSSFGSSGDGSRGWGGWSSGGFSRGGPPGGGSSGGSSGGPAQVDERIRAFADMALQRFDSNRDGRLQRDEWSRMRDNPQGADRNGDGIITRDELAQYMADRGRERWGDLPRSSDSSGGNGEPDRKSYRFLTAAERLPKGLPEWFTSNDANGDGQISMAEFTTNWNDAKVEEFMRYDLNGDGIITASECQAAAPPKR
jgi:Ca2+-binding EF-hand superfamily protein